MKAWKCSKCQHEWVRNARIVCDQCGNEAILLGKDNSSTPSKIGAYVDPSERPIYLAYSKDRGKYLVRSNGIAREFQTSFAARQYCRSIRGNLIDLTNRNVVTRNEAEEILRDFSGNMSGGLRQ